VIYQLVIPRGNKEREILKTCHNFVEAIREMQRLSKQYGHQIEIKPMKGEKNETSTTSKIDKK